MKISIFGLGYVGTVSAACFADMGHDVIGVDINQHKVDVINFAESPFVEAKLAVLIGQAVKNRQLRATTNAAEAITQSDISFICVGTPSKDNGDIDLGCLQQVCNEIGTLLADKQEFHVVVVRSTILPGTMRQMVIPLLEKRSGKKAGKDFGVCNNPEFMREGSAVDDFYNPPKIVIGATDALSGNMLQSIYSALPGKLIRCDMETGEMVKYAGNAWHATKVAFANEIGRLCKTSGIDSHEVMEIFCSDTKLNISPSYLRPGFAFGGSCLPKDVRALHYKAQDAEIKAPLLGALLVSNENQIRFGLDMILACKKKTIGFLGISFKAGTDDLRESPLAAIVQHLAGSGVNVHIYDSNREHMHSIIPDIKQRMISNLDELLNISEVVVIGNNEPEFAAIAAKLRPEQIVIDFVRIREIETVHKNYQGICW